MNSTFMTLGIGGLSLAIAGASVYTIDATEIAVVTEFGAPVEVRDEPGLYFRAPWPIHQVQRFDSRSRLLEIEATEPMTQDQINIVVETFLVWKIAEPQVFLESLRTTETAEARLKDLVVASVSAGLATQKYEDLLHVQSNGGVEFLPSTVLEEVSSTAIERFGVEVQDLRIQHIGLPVQNEQSIYEQMRAERLQEASQYRALGQEQADITRASADQVAAETLAGAEETAGKTRAQTEKEAAALLVKAYQSDPEFYRFLRQLELYDRIVDEETVVVIESGSPLLSDLGTTSP
jgi:membrane protease subunit HflC